MAVALVCGDLVQSATLGGALTTLQHGLAVPAPGGVLGAYTLPVTSLTTAQPKDQFKDGFVAVTDGDAAGSMGDMYQIKGHAAQAAAGLLTLDLYKPLKRAVTAGAAKADVLVCPTVVTAAYYCWLQTWGLCNTLVKTALTAGNRLQRDVAAAGSVGKTANTILTEIVGMAGWIVATTDSGIVYLTIRP
jgi:hypothetical protein